MPLKIVHEDAELIVIDKPAGLVVHPGAGQPDRTLLNALLAHAPALAGVPRAGIVHRLDKDTSGLLVVAKTVPAQTSLVRQLADRSMRRVYLAVVQGDPPGERRDRRAGRARRARAARAWPSRSAASPRGTSLPGRGTIRPGAPSSNAASRPGAPTRSACTSSTSAIRSSAMPRTEGGRGAAWRFPRQALHAAELTLLHPATNQPMTWKAPLPRDMRGLLDTLREEKWT